MKYWLYFLCLVGNTLYGLSEGEIKARVETLAKEHLKRNNAAGISIAVTKNSFEMEEPYQKIFCFGYSKRSQKVPLRESTLFRLGSLSKTFTSLLFASLLEEGIVAWEQEAACYVPKTFALPQYHDQSIKLIDLLLNVSSLPHLPTIPMKTYNASWAEVVSYFQKYKLPRAPGKKFEQSDLGYALLGHIASRVKKMPYERLLTERILEPLKLKDTYYSLPLSKMSLLATGYRGIVQVGDQFLDRDGSFFKPARGLVSTIHDMKTWLSFFLKMEHSSLDNCLKHIYKNCYIGPEVPSKKEIPAWRVDTLSSKRALLTYYEEGFYQGFAHCLAFIPDTKTGVAILSNNEYDVKSLAFAILESLN